MLSISTTLSAWNDDSATEEDVVSEDACVMKLADIVIFDPIKWCNVTLDQFRVGSTTIEEICQSWWNIDREEFWRQALLLLETVLEEKQNFGYDRRTFAGWQQRGCFPTTVSCGYKPRYWIKSEFDIMCRTLTHRWNADRRWVMTNGLLLKRIVLLTQMLHLLDLDSSEQVSKPLRLFCKSKRKSDVMTTVEARRKSFDFTVIPVTYERALNMISKRGFPIPLVSLKPKRHFISVRQILKSHLLQALEETQLPAPLQKRTQPVDAAGRQLSATH